MFIFKDIAHLNKDIYYSARRIVTELEIKSIKSIIVSGKLVDVYNAKEILKAIDEYAPKIKGNLRKKAYRELRRCFVI